MTNFEKPKNHLNEKSARIRNFALGVTASALVLVGASGCTPEETSQDESNRLDTSSIVSIENSNVSTDVSNIISEESETSNNASADSGDTSGEESNEASDATSEQEEPKEPTECGIEFYNWLTKAAKAAATNQTGLSKDLIEGHQLSSVTVLIENGKPVVIDYPNGEQTIKTFIVEMSLSREGFSDYQGYFHINKNADYLKDFCERFEITDDNWEDFYFTPDEIMAFDDVSCDDLKSVFKLGLNMSGVKLSELENDN